MNLLQRLGLNDARMKDNDTLFFYQLLITMCSVIKSGIRKDPLKDYCSELEKWSNIYVAQIGLGGAY